MKASFVSTTSISQALRYSQGRMQSELVSAQKEAVTQRIADRGLALGAKTAQSINIQRDTDRLNAIIDSNGLVSSRLSATQTGLSQIASSAQSLLSTLTTAASNGDSASMVTAAANATLSSLGSVLNTSLDGKYLFSGVNSDVKPFNGFDDGSAGKAAFDTAFETYFGFSQSSAQAENITAAQIGDFIATAVEPLFMGSGWSAMSNASDQGVTSRIALNETTQTSVTANAEGIRRIAMASAMVKNLMSGNLGEAAKTAVISTGLSMTGTAIADLTKLQSSTGIIEQRVSEASERLTSQVDLFEKLVAKTEGVDPAAAATRVSDLVNQIETSFALTARIQQLKLLNFLS